jgi:hypothetical protein
MSVELLRSPFPYAIGAIVGAAAFVGVGAHFSQLGLVLGPQVGPSASASYFRTVYGHVKNSQIAFILVTTLDASIAAFLSAGIARKFFAAGAIAQFAIIPFTVLALLPTNKKIIEATPAEEAEEVPALIKYWSLVNLVRPVLAGISIGLVSTGLHNYFASKRN